ncbi:hypothetical protein MN608_05510 [Microdochium nivale]|nr:hypothetical protein MN608_05510 [Microdochium nivale]
MDTLCIPVAAEALSWKLAQIERMSSIYKGAVSGLVLDAELMATPFRSERSGDGSRRAKVSVEVYARILCSIWMTRSWTYQDGLLPECLAIQFFNTTYMLAPVPGEHDVCGFHETWLDGPTIETRPLVLRSPSHHAGAKQDRDATKAGRRKIISTHIDPASFEPPLLSGPYDCVAISLRWSLIDTLFPDNSDPVAFAGAWNELSGRSTTMSEDVPIIVTNVLGFESALLIRYHDPGEMYHTILLSLGQVPMSLFLNTGSRQVELINNRWVPREIGLHMPLSEETATVHPAHLLYLYEGADRRQKSRSTASILVARSLASDRLPLSAALTSRQERARCSRRNLWIEVPIYWTPLPSPHLGSWSRHPKASRVGHFSTRQHKRKGTLIDQHCGGRQKQRRSWHRYRHQIYLHHRVGTLSPELYLRLTAHYVCA